MARRVLAAVACTFLNQPALMTVVPVVVQTATGRPGDGGLVTAFTSGATVCAELLMPLLLGRVRPGTVFAVGLVLMGGGSLAHVWLDVGVLGILALAILRGAGFGAAVVCAAVLVAELAPAHARGRAVGTMGLVVGLASMVSPSLGLLVLGSAGGSWVFGLAGAIALAGAAVVLGVDSARPRPATDQVQVHQGLGRPDLFIPVLGLALLTATYGGLVSFAPRFMEPSGLGSAASFFFAFGAARSLSRWLGGTATDRFGPRRVVLLGLCAACVGISLLAVSPAALVVLASGLLYGGGSGMAQSGSLVGMLERVRPGEMRLVGTLWNLAFDGGVSLGGAVLGLIAAVGGYASVVLAMPLLTLLAVLVFALAWHEPRRSTAST